MNHLSSIDTPGNVNLYFPLFRGPRGFFYCVMRSQRVIANGYIVDRLLTSETQKEGTNTGCSMQIEPRRNSRVNVNVSRILFCKTIIRSIL